MCSGRSEEHLGGGTTEQTALGPRRVRGGRKERRGWTKGYVRAEPPARHLAFFSRCRDGGVASILWGRIESPKARCAERV
jgi:hypothetical protein